MQGASKNFTMLLFGTLMSAVGGCVLTSIPYSIITDLLPPGQSRCGSHTPPSAIYTLGVSSWPHVHPKALRHNRRVPASGKIEAAA
jgi:hypothetical protein